MTAVETTTGVTIVLEADLFREIVAWAGQAVSKDSMIPILTGMHFTVGEPGAHVPHFTTDFQVSPMGGYAVTVACTDRYRAAWASALAEPMAPADGSHQAPGPFTMVVSAADLANAFKAWPRSVRGAVPARVFLRFDYDAKGRPLGLHVETGAATTRIAVVEGSFPAYRSFVSGEWLDEPTNMLGLDSRYLALLATATTKVSPAHTLRLRMNGGKPVGAMAVTGNATRVSALLMPRLGS